MMFVIGKLLLIFFRPVFWISALFCWGLFTRKTILKRRLLGITLIMLLFFSNPFVFRIIARAYESEPVALRGTFDAGIVLGGFVSYNVKTRSAFFNPASDRFIQTALLYKKGTIRNIIVAAGNGYIAKHDFQEAAFIRDHLVELGIPEKNIFIDPYSRNTLENAEYASTIADSLQFQPPIVLITSAMHMPRAQALFEKRVPNVQAFPCDFQASQMANNFWDDYLIPSSFTLRNWESLLKELAGISFYKITGKI